MSFVVQYHLTKRHWARDNNRADRWGPIGNWIPTVQMCYLSPGRCHQATESGLFPVDDVFACSMIFWFNSHTSLNPNGPVVWHIGTTPNTPLGVAKLQGTATNRSSSSGNTFVPWETLHTLLGFRDLLAESNERGLHIAICCQNDGDPSVSGWAQGCYVLFRRHDSQWR